MKGTTNGKKRVTAEEDSFFTNIFERNRIFETRRVLNKNKMYLNKNRHHF